MMSPRLISTSTLLFALLSAGSARAAVETPTYDALREARPEGRQLRVHDLTLERDVYRFELESGSFYFLPPVLERTFGAVFVGQGSYLLNPATEQERRHLAFVTAQDDFEVLRDDFETLVLLFADDTFEELGLHGPITEGAVDARATAAFERYVEWQKDDFGNNFQVRLLQDLMNAPTSRAGCFLAFIDGKEHSPALAAVDPRGASAVVQGPLMGGEDVVFMVPDDFSFGLWYMSEKKGYVELGRKTPYRPQADAEHFEIDFAIDKSEEVKGTTVVRFENLTANLRALGLGLAPTLRIEKAFYRPAEAEDGEWTEIGFIQEDKEEDANPAAVVFPEGLAKKAKVELKLEYAGEEVLDDAGEGNYTIGARTAWYPNFGIFTDMATYELAYRVPKGYEVISVGEELSTREEGDQVVSTWRSDIPIRVAGFNLGRFKRLERYDETSDINVLVYTNPGTPDIVREIDMALRSQSEGSFGGIGAASAERDMTVETQAQAFGVNTAKLADTALADGVNAARVCHTYFGPLPQRHVAITQQSQWGFGQSWPSLIYMPYISFLTSTQRRQLGMGSGVTDAINEIGYHEFAHQWWGHLIGWDSYRDQWLSEGFAEFSAALTLQHAQGWDEYDEHWENSREAIVSKFPGNTHPSYKVGPISQGIRLITRRSPTAYNVTTYNKGGFVLHMLRMLMREPAAPNPDARFIEMMRDFTSTWANKSPSTDDFQAAVERYMSPQMNATGDGKMDWFFDQWVHGTDIPRYTHDLKVQKAGGGKYRIQGTITQAEVSPGFRVLLPLYVEFKKGEYGQFGAIPMLGNSSRPIDVEVELPKKPRRALINAHHEVLAKN